MFAHFANFRARRAPRPRFRRNVIHDRDALLLANFANGILNSAKSRGEEHRDVPHGCAVSEAPVSEGNIGRTVITSANPMTAESRI